MLRHSKTERPALQKARCVAKRFRGHLQTLGEKCSARDKPPARQPVGFGMRRAVHYSKYHLHHP